VDSEEVCGHCREDRIDQELSTRVGKEVLFLAWEPFSNFFNYWLQHGLVGFL
jgi:hypothetical protein